MNDGFIPGIFIGCLAGLFAAGMLQQIRINKDHAKAIELHAAEWVIDPKTGGTTFTWKEAK